MDGMKRPFAGLAWAFLLLTLECGSVEAWSSTSADPSCDGSTIVLQLEDRGASSMAFSSSSSSSTRRAFYSLPSPFGPWPSLPRNASAATATRLLVAEPIDACKDLARGGGNSSSSAPFALLVARGGGCSFFEKVKRAKAVGAATVVVFNAGEQGCIFLGVSSNSSSPSREELEALPLTVSIDAASGARLLAAAASPSASSSSSSSSPISLLRVFEPLPTKLVDGSALVLGSLAVAGLLIGALLAARDEVERRTRRRTSEGNAAASAGDENQEDEGEDEDEDDEPLAFSSLSDVAFIVALMASALLAAFFFPRIFSFLLAALFVFGASDATGHAASRLFAKLLPRMRAKQIELPSFSPAFLWGKGTKSAAEAAEEEGGLEEAAPTNRNRIAASTLAGFALVALPAASTWLLLGPRRIWPLHDLLALALISSIPTGLRLPSLRACTALLLLAAANDVFFVFLQPRITKSESVMVSVATATPALVLLSPLQQGGPRAGFALLGFGDVVVPGAAVAFAARWDSLRRLRKSGNNARSSFSLSAFSSLFASVLGYCLGLSLTYLALYHRFGNSAGQPALLYLSPCVLLLTAGSLALRGGRSELRTAWSGLDSKEGREGRNSSRRRGGASSSSEFAPLVA